MKKKLFALLFLSSLCLGLSINNNAVNVEEINAAYSDSYYSNISGKKGDPLLEGLAKITRDNHTTYTSYEQLKSELAISDQNPNNGSELLDFYTRWSVSSTWDDSVWNREHVWPKSLSNDTYENSGAGSDIHHIRPSISGINGFRSNRKFADLSTSASKYYYESKDTGCYYDTGLFEPADISKGDTARILMYLYMHYSTEVSENENKSYVGELVITNIVDKGSYNSAWDLLIAWNELDPVDDFERNRNDYCATVTGTRNPFIDHPEFATMIWDGSYSGDGALKDNEYVIMPDEGEDEVTPVSDVTYTITSTSSVSSENSLEGSKATYSQTYTNAKGQLTSGNSSTLTLSGYDGYKVTGFKLSMKSNTSKGAGSLTVTSGENSVYSISDSKFNTSNWNGSWSTSYVDISRTLSSPYQIKEGNDLKFFIKSSENSLYIQSYTIYFEEVKEEVEEPSISEQISLTKTMVQLGMNYNEEEIIGDATSYYKLVTSVNELKANDKIIIVSSTANYALSSEQKNNNRGQTSVNVSNGKIASISSNVQVITLEEAGNNNFAFNVGNGYLYAASNSSNYLRTKTTLDSNGHWAINIDSKGIASIVAQGTYTRNVMQHNGSSSLFSCYSSASQNNVQIYKLYEESSTSTTYTFSNVKLRFVAIIPSDLIDYIDTTKGAGITLTLTKQGKSQTVTVPAENIVTEADGSLRFAVVLNVPEENYGDEVTGQAFVYVNGEKVYLTSSTSYSVDTLVEHYITYASSFAFNEDELAILNAFKNA